MLEFARKNYTQSGLE